MRTRLLMIVAVMALVATACGSDDGAGTTAPDESPATTAPAPATTGAESMDGVHAADSDLGEILVDADGFTLYIFTNDTDGESTCYDGCAELWPSVPGDAAISADLDQSMFGTTARTDGSEQLTVGGMPLYRYTPDSAPGDTTGQGFNDVWFVVGADGSAISAAAGGTTTVVDLGY